MEVAFVPPMYPYLQCNCEGCDRSMPLPGSSQLGKFLNLPYWPISEIREIFVNPECGHVCDYMESDVRWRSGPHVAPDRPERPFSALVQWNCDEQSCGTRVVIQRPTRGAIAEEELLTEARQKWIFVSAHCEKKHLLTKVPDDAWGWEIWLADADL